MTIKTIIMTITTLAFCYSCNSIIPNLPNKQLSAAKVNLKVAVKNNIFDEYLWTAPPISARYLKTQKDSTGYSCSVKIKDEKITLNYNPANETVEIKQSTEHIFKSTLQESTNNIYYDKNTLGIKYRTVMRWVSETEMENKQVAVQKTRQVPFTSMGPNGTMQTSYRTEFYTDYEWRMVPVTKWVWKSFQEPFLDIPKYKYCHFQYQNLTWQLILDEKASNPAFWLSNISYLKTHGAPESFVKDPETTILLIDNNADGIFESPSDRLLLSRWNPYSIENSYISLKGFINNFWYKMDFMENEYFFYFNFDQSNQILEVSNPNAKYQNIKKHGSFTLSPKYQERLRIHLNGRAYKFRPGVEYPIQYGKYQLRAVKRGYADYLTTFTINQDNPDFIFEYPDMPRAGTIIIKNIYAQNWLLTLKNQQDNLRTYQNEKKIETVAGEYELQLHVDGLSLKQAIKVEEGVALEIDYLQLLKEKIKEPNQ